MHAASREALAAATKYLDDKLFGLDNGVAVAAATGTELFDIVDLLDQDRPLRVALADNAVAPAARAELAKAVFGGKVSDLTLDVLATAVAEVWSTPREMRAGLVSLGRHSLLRAAEREGQLIRVEEELFSLSRLLDREMQLTALLGDRTATAAAKRALVAQVLYGKVSSLTEALVLQVIGRPEHNPIDDVAGLSEAAAAIQGKSVAHVVSAAALTDTQKETLAAKLSRIYGNPMSLHVEVDPQLLGGMVIRVGDELIDGSTSGALEKLRAQFA